MTYRAYKRRERKIKRIKETVVECFVSIGLVAWLLAILSSFNSGNDFAGICTMVCGILFASVAYLAEDNRKRGIKDESLRD